MKKCMTLCVRTYPLHVDMNIKMVFLNLINGIMFLIKNLLTMFKIKTTELHLQLSQILCYMFLHKEFLYLF